MKKKTETIQSNKLNLKNDIIFKAFFSKKGNEEYLIDFLSALLKIKIKKIEIKEEVSLEQLSKVEKGGRLDLQATLDNNIIVNIELQMKNEYNLEKRTIAYAGKVIAREEYRGIDYKNMKKVIMINILGYNMFKDIEDYVSRTAIVLDNHREYEVIDDVQWYFIELPKFRKQNPDMDDKVNQWLALIDGEREELVEMAVSKNKVVEKAIFDTGYLTGKAAEKRMAELREKWDGEYRISMNYAKNQGISQGITKNRKEIAKRMLERKMNIQDIIEITGLTKKEIENLKNK